MPVQGLTHIQTVEECNDISVFRTTVLETKVQVSDYWIYHKRQTRVAPHPWMCTTWCSAVMHHVAFCTSNEDMNAIGQPKSRDMAPRTPKHQAPTDVEQKTSKCPARKRALSPRHHGRVIPGSFKIWSSSYNGLSADAPECNYLSTNR